MQHPAKNSEKSIFRLASSSKALKMVTENSDTEAPLQKRLEGSHKRVNALATVCQESTRTMEVAEFFMAECVVAIQIISIEHGVNAIDVAPTKPETLHDVHNLKRLF